MALAIHWKDLILLVQIPHPYLAVQKGRGFAKDRVVYHFTRETIWMTVEVYEVHEDPVDVSVFHGNSQRSHSRLRLVVIEYGRMPLHCCMNF